MAHYRNVFIFFVFVQALLNAGNAMSAATRVCNWENPNLFIWLVDVKPDDMKWNMEKKKLLVGECHMVTVRPGYDVYFRGYSFAANGVHWYTGTQGTRTICEQGIAAKGSTCAGEEYGKLKLGVTTNLGTPPTPKPHEQPAPPPPEPSRPRPVECYDLYQDIPFKGYEYRQRFCAVDGSEQCRRSGDLSINRFECRFVSSKTPTPTPTATAPSPAQECWTLTFYAGPGLLVSEQSRYCVPQAKNRCFAEADRRNVGLLTGRYSCIEK